MATTLILYGTGEGQTAKVAERLGERIETRGHVVEVVDVEDAPANLPVEDYDAVLVGSSIHVGKHEKGVKQFVERNLDALHEHPTGFFQVSLSSAVDDERRRAEAGKYVDDFVEATGWNPDRIGLFGGALRYSKYGFLKRLMLKRIAKDATGDTDTSRDYEYTDWEEVEAFADDFAGFVEARLGVAPGEPAE